MDVEDGVGGCGPGDVPGAWGAGDGVRKPTAGGAAEGREAVQRWPGASGGAGAGASSGAVADRVCGDGDDAGHDLLDDGEAESDGRAGGDWRLGGGECAGGPAFLPERVRSG